MLLNLRRILWTNLKNVYSVSKISFVSTRGLSTRWCEENIYGNPVDELHELVEIPLLNANETAFSPSTEEIKKADDVFRRLQVTAINGVLDASLLPDAKVSEVCFIGQSNVGKSSLIKALLYDPKKIKINISKTPGCTTTLNFYHLGKLFTLVDVPGYGMNMPEHYVQSVENYVQTRKSLVRTLLLIDGATGLTDVDKIGIEMMEEFGKPYLIVMTKIDKASHHVVLRHLLEIKRYRDEKMPSALDQIFLVSALQNAGVPFLRALIMNLTGN